MLIGAFIGIFFGTILGGIIFLVRTSAWWNGNAPKPGARTNEPERK